MQRANQDITILIHYIRKSGLIEKREGEAFGHGSQRSGFLCNSLCTIPKGKAFKHTDRFYTGIAVEKRIAYTASTHFGIHLSLLLCHARYLFRKIGVGDSAGQVAAVKGGAVFIEYTDDFLNGIFISCTGFLQLPHKQMQGIVIFFYIGIQCMRALLCDFDDICHRLLPE